MIYAAVIRYVSQCPETTLHHNEFADGEKGVKMLSVMCSET